MVSKRLLILSIAVLLCGIVCAQKTVETSLDEVVVKGRNVFKDAIPSLTMDSKTLERLNSLSVADALRYFSGLQIKDYGGVGGIKTVNIRSMGSQHLGVYYDGIELGNAQNGQIDLGQYSLDNVEEITLYNGQKSSLMQTASDYGNAGSVYIRTRMPRFINGEKYHLKAKVKYGSSNLLNMGVVYEPKFSRMVCGSFTLGTITSDGKYKFRYKRKNYDGTIAYDTTAIRQNGDVQSLRFEGNVMGRIDGGDWRLKAYTYQSGRGIPGAIVNNVWHREERQTDGNTFVQGTIQKDFSTLYSARLLAKYAHYYTHYQNRDTTTMMVNNKYWQNEWYLSTTHAFHVARWLAMSLAYDARYNTLTSDAYNCPVPRRWTHLASVASALTLSRFNAQASVLYTYAHDTGEGASSGSTPVGIDNTTSRFTPAFFFCYYPLKNKSVTVRGYVKNSFRMPTFNDLYYTEVGNADLKPEKALQYDLGFTLSPFGSRLSSHVSWLTSLELKVDGYYNVVTDKIIAYPKGQQFRWTMMNLGKVHITGLDVDLASRYKFNKVEAGLRLQYTYQQAIDVTDPNTSYYRDQIPYIPRHSGSVIADAEWNGLSLTYSFIYTGERYNEKENIQYNYMQPWYTSDLSLAYRFTVKKTEMRATLECNNLFSQDYDVILNYPMPKRNYAISLDVKI